MTYWLLFFSAAVTLNLAPGPDLIYVMSRTIAQGTKIGLAASFGVCTGALVHVMAAAFGLSAILTTSAFAFSIIKQVGAAYLLYLGTKALFSKETNFAQPGAYSTQENPEMSSWVAFKRGLLVDILNPKVAIFFMAFLPQFVRSEIGHPSGQIIFLGSLVILVALGVEVLLVCSVAHFTDIFRRNQHCAVWLDRLLGSVLITLGLQLAFSKKPS